MQGGSDETTDRRKGDEKDWLWSRGRQRFSIEGRRLRLLKHSFARLKRRKINEIGAP